MASDYEAKVGGSERLQAFREAAATVQHDVDRFTVSPVFKFSKYKYFCMTVLSYFTVWMAGKWTANFWKWHFIQYVILLPLQVYRWTRIKNLAYLMEFCWVSNFCIMMYLAICWWAPDALKPDVSAGFFHWLFALGSGPLGGSVILTSNALVPHSIDHTMMLLIHLQPMVTAHTLKYYAEDRALFPVDHEVEFHVYCWPAVLFAVVHGICYGAFFLLYGLTLDKKGFHTAYHDLLGHDNFYTKYLGKAGTGGDYLRFLKFDLLQTLLVILVILVTYPLFLLDQVEVSAGIVIAICVASAWQGAGWYNYHINRFTRSMQAMISTEEGKAQNQTEVKPQSVAPEP